MSSEPPASPAGSEFERLLDAANGHPTAAQRLERYVELSAAQQEAWRRLQRLGCDPQMTGELARGLARNDLLRSVRIMLIETAGCARAESPEVAAQLRRISIANPASDESIAAFKSLAKMGDVGFETLVWFATNAKREGNRINAVHVLARIRGRGPQARQVIEHVAKTDAHWRVRHYAHATLDRDQR